jgi:hypothetical protein
MERKQVGAILADYDGTLCPTNSVPDDRSYGGGTIPYYYGFNTFIPAPSWFKRYSSNWSAIFKCG